jgi:intein/homing endonuclease
MRTGKQLDVGPCLTLDNEWVYVAELIRGDGHISDNLWYIYFINKNRRLINIVKRFFIRIGVDKKSIDIRTVNGVANLVVRTNLLAYLLKHIFNVPTGRKGEMNLPGFYRNSKEFAVAAIRAAFDAEGTVSIGNPSPRRIVITSISKNWLFDLKELLLLFKINSEVHYEDRHETAPIYRLRIYGQTQLKSFLNVIGSAHSERLLKLKTLLKTYSENRVPEGSMKVKVLEVLRAKKPMKRQQIASALNFKKKLLGWHLNSLKQNGLVEIAERVYTNRGSYFKYRITDLGLAELTNESGPQ